MFDISIHRAFGERVTINVAGAPGEGGDTPPHPTSFTRKTRCSPPPPPAPRPPFSRLIHSDKHLFLLDEMLSVTSNMQDCMAWRGPRTTTGRGSNARIGARRDTNPARGDGDGLGTSRGARPTDHFERGAAGQPRDWCVARGIGSYRLWNTETPPPNCELKVLFEQRPRQMARSRQFQWRDRLGARTSLAVSLGIHFERRGITERLKLDNSDSRKAWSLTKLAVRCRSPGNLEKINW